MNKKSAGGGFGAVIEEGSRWSSGTERSLRIAFGSNSLLLL